MHETMTLDTPNGAMPTLVFKPESDGPHPALIIAQHLPVAHAGLELDQFQIDVGVRYAKHGYLCVMPYLFHHWPADAPMEQKRDEFRDDWTIADLKACWQLLEDGALPEVSAVGILGHCWGGRIAWLGACHLPDLAGCAVFYGGRIKMPFAGGEPAPISLADQIRCPLLGIFGNDDTAPSPDDVDDYARALSDAGVLHEFHRYDCAGHGFQDFTNGQRYAEQASEDAWCKALDFFQRTVGSH
ncbi:MAG: hypothetical protein CMO26_13040 [Thiotrichales bacterium]|nr:hypothetical protein [Thiotrichales bacterium]|tara:strand:- start:820 stop:1545 length:726 start_codon:yes stop_codon:yes gene_type:complete